MRTMNQLPMDHKLGLCLCSVVQRYLFAIMLFLSCMHATAAPKFVSVHSTSLANICVVFPAFDQVQSHSRAVFFDPMWAIDVVSVRVDGNLLNGVPATISFSVFDDRALTLEAGEQFIYRVNVEDLMFSDRDEFSASSFSLERFLISTVPDEVEVAYRVRYPDGSKSPEMETRSVGRWVVDRPSLP